MWVLAPCVCVCVCAQSLGRVWLCVTPWTVAHQAPLSMGFSRQEYWSGLPCLFQGIFPTQGSNSCLLHLLHRQMGSLLLVPPGKPLSSPTRDWTFTPCIGRWSVSHWTSREFCFKPKDRCRIRVAYLPGGRGTANSGWTYPGICPNSVGTQ